MQSVIDVAFNRDKEVFCASIVFSKAFDYINRDCLWYKLLKSGIRGNIFNIIKNMYMNTFSKVKYDHFFFGDKLLTISNSVSYLGLVLCCSGKFSQTQSNLADQGLKAVYKFFNDTHELYALDSNFLCSLFDKIIQPVLVYMVRKCGVFTVL